VKPYVFHPEADEEYLRAADYYFGIAQDLGLKFFDEIEGLIRDVANTPDTYPFFDGPVRRHFSTDFPYALLYIDQIDRIFIVAVSHMKRRPGYWRELSNKE
jgi:plasmid stabilization system protein ParE